MKKIPLFFIVLVCMLAAQLKAADDFLPQSKWIGSEQCQSTPNTWLCFRKTVHLPGVPGEMIANIAVDSKYWLWINGKMVAFEGGLKRGPAPGATYYDQVDIAPYLEKGENTIALLVWHFGKNGFSHVNSGTAALLFCAQGANLSIVSDKSWQCSVYRAYQNTEAPFPNYRLSESNIRFDARKELAGWNMPDFSGKLGASIEIVAPNEMPFGKLVARPIPMWKNGGLTDYPEVVKNEKGDTIRCRLPYNCQITPYLHVKAPAGLVVGMLTDNYTGGSANNVRAEYITREGEQEYESFGWMNGHEVLYVVPAGVEVLGVKYRETGYNADMKGSFACDDDFYNELWKRSARTLYITMRDNYMDCPDRERAQWWGDEVNELGEAFYVLDPRGWQLATKGIYELMNWQRPDGVIASPVPSLNWCKELPLQMLASVGWYGFYTQAFYSDDYSFVPHIYDGLKKYLHEVWQVDGQGMPVARPGDWNWGDWGTDVDMEVLTTCWYYLALKAEKEFALHLRKLYDANQIGEMMQRISVAFDARYWNGKAYRSKLYNGETDDRAQAMAVVSGLAPAGRYKALLKVFKKEYHASPYMEKYVMEALFMMGEPEFALKRMRDRYAKMMSYPYTTLFEGWGIGAEGFGGGTINHAWSGGPLTILSQKLCGIEPLAPGFKQFRVAPQLGSLNKASAVVPTLYGDIRVDIRQQDHKIGIQVVVPQGTTAVVALPGSKEKVLSPGTHILP
ncbi:MULTISPECIES: alpha-L-rhamnosidase C-terminal domain-containing protein [Bacteroides]|jgi:alpha-L-rhamnosidase|uniref:alpha-L-rhamnosidase-related protein n=1 Tax=Bacteroides TaxID=816 RepID=UPI000E4E0CDE|nr:MULTISPECIES: alpha-L-rhamnosidase C-terminal domain-containing protein [Bacteroides]RHL09309.1 glycoside hydrolase [Bacteroides sp. AF39-11AC]